jgi:hypothetical protein
MKDKKKPQKKPLPTQKTPAGATIPVPSEEDFFRDLAKVAKPQEKSAERCPEDKD